MSNAKKIWNYLVNNACFTKAGAAGLMGNLIAESGLQPNKLENIYKQKYGTADESYTAAVDNGAISEQIFMHPAPNKQYGYGLAQWTSPDRKQRLYRFAKKKGVSIGDLEMQLEFMVNELHDYYQHVWVLLTSTDDVKLASDTVLKYYEAPANAMEQSTSRYNNSLKFFQEFAQPNGVTVDAILDVFRSWVGLSRSDLSHKPIIDLYNSYRPLARGYQVTYADDYCDVTVSAAFIKLGAVDLICGTECGVEEHVRKFQNGGIWEEDGQIVPFKGDIIVFDWDGEAYGYSDHIGIVEYVDGNEIHTIEGNINGGVVGRRIIPVGWGYIRGYAHPKYAVVENKMDADSAEDITLEEVVNNVIRGVYGNGEERKKSIEALGFSYEEVQVAVNAKLQPVAQNEPEVAPAYLFDENIAGEYVVTADRLNVRYKPGYLQDDNIRYTLYEGEKVRCYGYYSDIDAIDWYLISHEKGIGHVSAKWLKRV